jgi:hypothetical protein
MDTSLRTSNIMHLMKTELYIFERKILRKIYGPTQNPDGTWRIKTNDELRHRMK